MHLHSFVNQINEINKFVNETYITIPKALFFKTTDPYSVYLFSE